MTILKRSLVAAGVATAVFAAGAAQAAATVNFPAAGLTYGKTGVANETIRTTLDQQGAGVILGFPAGEGLNIDDSVSFTLTGGAVWRSIGNADISDNQASASTYALVSGGVGKVEAVFRVAGADNNTTVAFNITLADTATINAAGVADNGAVGITVGMSGFVGGQAVELFGSPLSHLAAKLVPAQTGAITNPATGAPAAGVFDVAEGFHQLTAATDAAGGTLAPLSLSASATITLSPNVVATANGATTANVPLGAPHPW